MMKERRALAKSGIAVEGLSEVRNRWHRPRSGRHGKFSARTWIGCRSFGDGRQVSTWFVEGVASTCGCIKVSARLGEDAGVGDGNREAGWQRRQGRS